MVENGEININYVIGTCLAVSATIFIGLSYVIKKKGLLKNQASGHIRAGDGGHSYLKETIWWAGFLTMVLGEAANFAAYMFVPATLVAPLNAFSIFISTVAAQKFLNEKLNHINYLGCALCTIGMIIIITHAPQTEEVTNYDEIFEELQDPVFLCYIIFIGILCLVLVCWIGPSYGKDSVLVYVTICSIIGSITVPCSKGLGMAIKKTLTTTTNAFYHPFTWILIPILLIAVLIQIHYLNKALDLFHAAVVSPLYYIMFTTFVMLISIILFKEWTTLNAHGIMSMICGFVCLIIAILLINCFKDKNGVGIIVRKYNKNRRKMKLEDEESLLSTN